MNVDSAVGQQSDDDGAFWRGWNTLVVGGFCLSFVFPYHQRGRQQGLHESRHAQMRRNTSMGRHRSRIVSA